MPYLPPTIHRQAAEKQASNYQEQQGRRCQEERKRELPAEMRRRSAQTKQKR